MDHNFYRRIAISTARRESRESNAFQILENLAELPELLAMGCLTSDEHHHKAMWILEIVAENNIVALVPYIEHLCDSLPLWKKDGAQRSAAKIAMLLLAENSTTPILTSAQLHQVAEQCFDWLIDDSKVAVKAYSIYALFEAGKSQKWIYPELQQILTKDYANQSTGYKAAARKVLKKMEREVLKGKLRSSGNL